MRIRPYKRKRTGKTDYKKRIILIKSGLPRLVVRTSNNNISVQVIEYAPEGDKVLLTSNSNNLKTYKLHKGNMPVAYLTGLMAGVKAKKLKIKKCILDTGLHKPRAKSKVYAALKGFSEMVEIPHAESVLPEEKRINGEDIQTYTLSLSGEDYNKKFSTYARAGINADKIIDHIKKVKMEIKQ